MTRVVIVADTCVVVTPILPKHAFDKETFDQTTLKPVTGSGPYRIAEVEPVARPRIIPFGAATTVKPGSGSSSALV